MGVPVVVGPTAYYGCPSYRPQLLGVQVIAAPLRVVKGTIADLDSLRETPRVQQKKAVSLIYCQTNGLNEVSKNNILLHILSAASLFVLPAIGHAQATDGPFVSGNLGNANFDRGEIDVSDTSYGVNFGYRWAVSPGTLIGFEAGYVKLGEYSAPASVTEIAPIGTPPNDPVTYFGRGNTEMSGWMIGANGRFNLSPNWYIGGRAGFIRASVDTHIRINRPDDSVIQQNYDDNADGWYAGAGIGYDFSNKFSLGLNYDYYSAEKSGSAINPDVVSVSGEYRF